MIKIKSTYCLIFALVVLFSACEKTPNNVVIPAIPESQVLKLIIEPNTTLSAFCSRTASITQPIILESLINIQVKNPKKSQSFFFDFISPGLFQWNCNLQPRDSFIVTYQGILDTFQLADKIPAQIKIQSVDTATAIVPGIGKTQTFTIRFRDSAIDKNYYQLYVKREFIQYDYLPGSTTPNDSQTVSEILRIDGNELPFIRNAYNGYTDNSLLFNDEIFNGVNAKFQFHNLKPWGNSIYEKTLSVEIVLENVSLPLYQYLNTEAAHLWQKQSVTQLPNPLFSNIPNGFGILGAKTTDKIKIFYSR